MALFDPERKRVVVRVVYDGPGHAGKTTNLQRLCKSFASWRRSDMVSPNTVGERTQYFDWLEVDGGVMQGYPVRAQLLTVPGQVELRLRRQFVIERADVVVFVADSQPEAVAEARSFYAELCEQVASFEQPIPIVFQANKQDVRGALKPPELAKQVCAGLTKPAHVANAVAFKDKGVKQTLAVALRLASEQVRTLWAGDDLKTKLGEVGDAERTLAALEHRESELSRGRPALLTPTLPTADLPSTQIWPPVSGRAVLARVAGLQMIPHSDPAHPERTTLHARAKDGAWRLTSGSARRYADLDEAQRALLLLCRRKVALGTWLPEPCACATVADPQGQAVWLWTLDPILPTLADELAVDDPERRREALLRFAEAALGAEALAERAQLVVELAPACFGLQRDDHLRTRYIGHVLEPGETVDLVGPLLAVAQGFLHSGGQVGLGDRSAHQSGEATQIALAELREVLCSGLQYVPTSPARRQALSQAFEDRLDELPAGLRWVCEAALIVLARAAASPDDDTSEARAPASSAS